MKKDLLIKSKNEFPVVGIGASAGGLKAFKSFIKNIPEKSDIAYVLVQHLDPDHKSLLSEILQKVTKIPVLEITDDIDVEPDNIYILPANKMLMANDGILKLEPRPKPEKGKTNLPINLFFDSLANVHQSHSIGVVLSGSGSDGTEGFQAIKNKGGTTFAQDEASAEWKDMPRNAAEAGVVDFVLPPEKIPAKILELLGARHSDKKEEQDNSEHNSKEIKQILDLLHVHRGTDFTYYKKTTISRRIERRRTINKCENIDAYLNFVKNNNGEKDLLYQDLLIPVTDFFRDPEIFDQLCQTVFPLLLKNRKDSEAIRIWVAGCSTGQEAYTFAMCLREQMDDNTELRGKVQIFATDISEPAIIKARKGLYTKEELSSLGPERIRKFFTKSTDEYRINKEVREMCVFAEQDFLKHPPFGNMDLISCRNVLIYMEPYLQKKALTTFYYGLKPKGFLLLGKSETGSTMSELFAREHKASKLYVRKEVPGQVILPPKQVGQQSSRERANRTAQIEDKATNFEKAANTLLLNEFTPAGVVVNEVLDIVYFKGDTGNYLQQQTGKPSYNLVKIARPGLSFELRSLLQKAKKNNDRVQKENIPIKVGNNTLVVSLEAVPLPNMAEPYFMVIFHTESLEAKTMEITEEKGKKSGRDQKDRLIAQLQKELQQTREDIREISEEQEAANEELQSSNEELLSSSEELQSLNEELETSKEELQSTNEELTSVNQELVSLNDELGQERDFAEAIISTLREPFLVLDKNLKVIAANQAFYNTFEVTSKETEEHSIYSIGNNQWDIPKLRSLLESLLPKNESIEDFEVSHDFENIGKRSMILNARDIKREGGAKKLILLGIEDITVRKNAEEKLKESLFRFKELIHSSPILIAILRGEVLIIAEANDSMLKIWGKSQKDVGKPFFEVFPEMKKQGMQELLSNVFKTGKSQAAYETPIEHYKEGKKYLHYYDLICQPQRDIRGGIEGVAIVANEITKQAELHKKIKESEVRFHQMTELMPEKINSTNASGEIIYYNKKWEEYTGHTMEHLVNKGWAEVVLKEDLALFEKNWMHALKTGNVFEMEIPIRDKNSNYNWHLCRAESIKNEQGEITSWIGVSTEIQKIKEEEKRKQEFLKLVSHELKTPITSIKGYTQLLLHLLTGDKKVELDKVPIISSLLRIDNQVSRLNRLISEILDLSRVEETQLHLHKEGFSMNELVKTCVEDIRLTTEISKISIFHEAEFDVDADKDRIGQVLINLVTNAIKYSPDNPNIEIHVFKEDDNHGAVSVKDQGIGIGKEDQKNIFKRFYRVSGKNEATYSGMGVGLYLAMEIIKRHDGNIRVESKKNGGSKFIFTLPLHSSVAKSSIVTAEK